MDTSQGGGPPMTWHWVMCTWRPDLTVAVFRHASYCHGKECWYLKNDIFGKSNSQTRSKLFLIRLKTHSAEWWIGLYDNIHEKLFRSFLMIRRPPRSTPKPSSAASDVYKRQERWYLICVKCPNQDPDGQVRSSGTHHTVSHRVMSCHRLLSPWWRSECPPTPLT